MTRCTATSKGGSAQGFRASLHGYDDCWCHLPLDAFCGRHRLAAKLRRSNTDAAAGAVEEVERIVGPIRARWPGGGTVLRAGSGFAREALMAWCGANRVDDVVGLARNDRLTERIADELAWAEEESASAGRPARRFADLLRTTRAGWSRRRRVVEGRVDPGRPRSPLRRHLARAGRERGPGAP